MNKQELINRLKARIEQEHAKLKEMPEDEFLDRAISIGTSKGLLLAWEIVSNMEN